MNASKYAEQFFEKSIQVENIVQIETMLWTFEPGQYMDDFGIDDIDEIAELLGLPIDEDADEHDFVERIASRQIAGWLVRFVAPAFRSETFSSGLYTAALWIYAATYEDACEKALEWRSEYMAKNLKGSETEMSESESDA